MDTHRAMLCPLVYGSNKTTVSVATRQHDYYPLYQSIGNATNTLCHAHKEALLLCAFLSIPKSMSLLLAAYVESFLKGEHFVASQEHANDPEYWKFQ